MADKSFHLIPALSVLEGRPVVISGHDSREQRFPVSTTPVVDSMALRRHVSTTPVVDSMALRRHVSTTPVVDYEPLEDEDGHPLTPSDVASRLFKRFPRIALLDLDGIHRNRPQLDLVGKLSALGEVWLDAGVRRVDEDTFDLLTAGASSIILGTKCLASLEEVENALDFTEEVALSIDIHYGCSGDMEPQFHGMKGRVLSPSREVGGMDPQAIARLARSWGVKRVILSRLDGKKVDRSVITRTLGERVPVYAAGGLGMDDAKWLTDAGAAGALLDLLPLLEGIDEK